MTNNCMRTGIMIMLLQWWAVPIVVALVGILSQHLARRLHNIRLARQWGCLAPAKEVNTDPIFGLDRAYEVYKAFQAHRYIPYYTQRFRNNGQTFSTFVLLQHKLYTVHPLNMENIFARDAHSYCIGEGRVQAFRPFLGGGAFAATGKAWRWSRHLLLAGLPNNRAFNTDLFAQHADHLLARLPPSGECVDLQDLFLDMTMDSATDLLFGRSLGLLHKGHDQRTEDFWNNTHEVQRSALRRIRLGFLTRLSPKRNLRIRRATERCRSYVSNLVAAMSDDPASLPECMLRHLLQSKIKESEVVDQLLTVLFAARDTTAALLSTQFHILARQPQVWNRLREEVAVFRGEKPSIRQVRELKYVSWVTNETLRLHPPVPHNTRVAIKDTTLPSGGGPDGKCPIFVAKGQTISYDVHTLHRDPSIFGPDQEEFKPERWEKLEPGWGYQPFGAGARLCLGKRLALVEVAYTTVRLAQFVERIEPRDTRDWQEQLTFTCINRNGTKVALFRESCSEKSIETSLVL